MFKKQTLLFMTLVLSFTALGSYKAYANLLITPLQVVFSERERTAEVVLVNNSRDTNTYRLRWEQLEQVQDTGGYIAVSEEDRESRTDFEDFGVFTPRQITLAPNEKQTIRIAARRPKDLAEGEYKSHLKFAIVPDLTVKAESDKEVADNEIGVGAKVYASYSIPVVYRTGEYDAQFEIGSPKISRNPNTNKILLDIPIERTGKHGVIGLITVFFKPNGGEAVQIGTLGNASIFSEITKRDFTVVTSLDNMTPGELTVIYAKAEGKAENYSIIQEKVFPVGQ